MKQLLHQRNMRRIFFLTIYLALFLVPCLAQTKEAVKIDDFDQSYYEDAIGRIGVAASALMKDSSLTAYIIVAGDEKYAGRSHRYANRLKNYLVNQRNIEAKRVVAIGGDCQQPQHTEIWLVPDGAIPPVPNCNSSSMQIPVNQIIKFDAYPIKLPNEGEWLVWDGSFEDEFTRLGKIGELLKQRLDLHLYIVGRAQGVYEYKPIGKKRSDGKQKHIQTRSRKLSDPLGFDLKIANDEKKYLIKKYGIQASRTTVIGRGYSLLKQQEVEILDSNDVMGATHMARRVELWLVPNNTPKSKLSEIFQR